MATVDPVNAMLDGFVEQVQSHFKAFILARTCHELGSSVVDVMTDDTLATATIGLNVKMEPIPVSELRAFRAIYPDFVVEVFHGKLLQHWTDLLHSVFSYYLDLHLSGVRQFAELGKTQVRIDLGQAMPAVDQLRESLCTDFDFRKQAERQHLVARLRDAAGDAKDEADTILRHVHIRNAIQHHHGVAREFVFKELGCQELTLLDESGTPQAFRTDDKVAVSVPELDKLRRALLVTAQRWRTK